MTPGDVGSGIVDGGWTFVTAAYVLTWVMLIGYTLSLWIRSREEE